MFPKVCLVGRDSLPQLADAGKIPGGHDPAPEETNICRLNALTAMILAANESLSV